MQKKGSVSILISSTKILLYCEHRLHVVLDDLNAVFLHLEMQNLLMARLIFLKIILQPLLTTNLVGVV